MKRDASRKVRLLSVVVPCHNEAEALPATHERLTDVLDGLAGRGRIEDYEIVYVDNGSTDPTLDILEDLFDASPKVRVVALRRNFGYQGSLSAGLASVRGDAAVTIDADLQDPPEKIDEMLARFEEGYDLVLGVRADRSSDTRLKRFFAESYYRLMRLAGVEIVHNHGDFRLMSRSLVREFNALSERNRFIRAMILQLDSRYATVRYKREPRTAGKTKFRLGALLSLSLDGLVSFTYVPLRLAAAAGLILCLLAMTGILWVLYIKLSRDVIPGWASTLLPIFALGGFQLFIMGLMGEYLGRLYVEVKQRPLFVVRKEYAHARAGKEADLESR